LLEVVVIRKGKD